MEIRWVMCSPFDFAREEHAKIEADCAVHELMLLEENIGFPIDLQSSSLLGSPRL